MKILLARPRIGNKGGIALGMLLGILAMSLSAAPANAALIDSFAASEGTQRDATVAFYDDGGGILRVVLTNVETNDIIVQGNLLQGVAFSLFDGSGALVALSVTGGNTGALASAVFHQPALDVGGHAIGDLGVGYEWGYTSGASVVAQTGSSQNWIAGVGAGSLLGPMQRWDESHNLQGPASPDGSQYGITSAGDNVNTGQSAVSGDNALVKNQITFTLSGLVGGDYSITDVQFQYGTDIDLVPATPPGEVIPEPATLSLLGLGLMGFAMRRRVRA